MKTTERTVHFYDLIMRSETSAEGIQSPGCTDLGAVLKALTDLGISGQTISKRKSQIIQIADWKRTYSGDQVHVLINRADKNESDVAFKDFETGTIRKGNKTADEGVDFSAHVVIQHQNSHPRGQLLLTMGAGISAQFVSTMLNVMTRKLAGLSAYRSLFYFPHPSGACDANGEISTYKVRYRFECLAHKSLLLDDALANGNFISAELLSHEYSQFDGGGNFQIEQYALTVKAAVPETVTGATLINAFRAFSRANQQHVYDKLRVRYKTESGTSTTTLNTNDLDAAFTHKKVISLDIPQEQQQLTLSREIIGKMQELL